MYKLKNSDGTKSTIKRLSKYEKRVLYNLCSDGCVNLDMMRSIIGIPHRSSMTRLVKTLEVKGLIQTGTRFNGKYNKFISLTPGGKTVGKWVLENEPIGNLVGKSRDTI